MNEELFDYAKRIQFLDLSQSDFKALKAGVREVFSLMRDGQWYSPEEIIEASRGREGLRRMRELRHCGFAIEKGRIPGSRTWHYRITNATKS